jgi:hypothetical protein
MAKGDFVAFKTMSEMEQALSSFPGTEETGIFAILRAVRPSPDIGELNVVREPFRFKKILQDFGLLRIKAKVNVNREEFIMNGDPFASFLKEVEERQAILSSRDSHQYSVPFLDQTITVDRFSHQAPNLFFPVSHNPKPYIVQSAESIA